MKRALILLVLLTACASPSKPKLREPTTAEWQAADFGSPPGNYTSVIRNYLADIPRDLNNTTFRFKGNPTKTWIGEVPNFQYGYGICVEMSEKTVDIEHIDFEPTFFFLMNGAVMQMQEGTEAARTCSQLGHIPTGAELKRAQ